MKNYDGSNSISTWFNARSNELVELAKTGSTKGSQAHQELSRLREIWWCTMWQIARDTTTDARHIN